MTFEKADGVPAVDLAALQEKYPDVPVPAGRIIIFMLLVGVMTLGMLTGCSSDTEENQENETQQETDAGDSEEPAEDAETSAGQGRNILVVYYLATGNTERENRISQKRMNSIFIFG